MKRATLAVSLFAISLISINARAADYDPTLMKCLASLGSGLQGGILSSNPEYTVTKSQDLLIFAPAANRKAAVFFSSSGAYTADLDKPGTSSASVHEAEDASDNDDSSGATERIAIPGAKEQAFYHDWTRDPAHADASREVIVEEDLQYKSDDTVIEPDGSLSQLTSPRKAKQAQSYSDSGEDLLKAALKSKLGTIDLEMKWYIDKLKDGTGAPYVTADALKQDLAMLEACALSDSSLQEDVTARISNIKGLLRPLGRGLHLKSVIYHPEDANLSGQ